MKINEGNTDRVIRIVAGIVLLSLTFMGPKTNWGYVGLVPLLTGIYGVCPGYMLFGFSTTKKVAPKKVDKQDLHEDVKKAS